MREFFSKRSNLVIQLLRFFISIVGSLPFILKVIASSADVGGLLSLGGATPSLILLAVVVLFNIGLQVYLVKHPELVEAIPTQLSSKKYLEMKHTIAEKQKVVFTLGMASIVTFLAAVVITIAFLDARRIADQALSATKDKQILVSYSPSHSDDVYLWVSWEDPNLQVSSDILANGDAKGDIGMFHENDGNTYWQYPISSDDGNISFVFKKPMTVNPSQYQVIQYRTWVQNDNYVAAPYEVVSKFNTWHTYTLIIHEGKRNYYVDNVFQYQESAPSQIDRLVISLTPQYITRVDDIIAWSSSREPQLLVTK